MTGQPVKTQICLGIRPVWSKSSLSAWRKLGSLAFHWAHIKDWADWMYAQADLSFHWVHRSFCCFCHVRLILRTCLVFNCLCSSILKVIILFLYLRRKIHTGCWIINNDIVPGRPATFAYRRARACCACSRCGTGWVGYSLFIFFIYFPFLMSCLLGDGWTWLKYYGFRC